MYLPRSQHSLDVGADGVEFERRAEIVTRRQVVANLLRRHRWDDGPLRDVGGQLLDCGPELVKRHVNAQVPMGSSQKLTRRYRTSPGIGRNEDGKYG